MPIRGVPVYEVRHRSAYGIDLPSRPILLIAPTLGRENPLSGTPLSGRCTNNKIARWVDDYIQELERPRYGVSFILHSDQSLKHAVDENVRIAETPHGPTGPLGQKIVEALILLRVR
jgi:hypothetical protein